MVQTTGLLTSRFLQEQYTTSTLITTQEVKFTTTSFTMHVANRLAVLLAATFVCFRLAFAQRATSTFTESMSATSTATSGDACLRSCADQAAQANGCTNAKDFACICASDTFSDDVTTCIANDCPSASHARASAIANSDCASSNTFTGKTHAHSTSRAVSSSSSTASLFLFSGSIQSSTSSSTMSPSPIPSTHISANTAGLSAHISSTLAVFVTLMGIALGALLA